MAVDDVAVRRHRIERGLVARPRLDCGHAVPQRLHPLHRVAEPDRAAQLLEQLHHPAHQRMRPAPGEPRSEEHTSELQSLMRISYAVFCLKTKNTTKRKSYKTIYTKRHNIPHPYT